MDGLILHAGAKEITREGLAALPAPQSLGRFHRPIPHIKFIEEITRQTARFGLKISREHFGVTKDGAKLFGVLKFAQESIVKSTKAQWAMGIRSSTDESIARQGIAGVNVFVCDNMAFSGTEFVFTSKSTLYARLDNVVERGMKRYLGEQEATEAEFARLESVNVDDKQASEIFTGLVRAQTLPDRYIGKAVRNYFSPGELETDVQPRSLWGIHNAVTRQLRESSLATKIEHTQSLSRFLAKVA